MTPAGVRAFPWGTLDTTTRAEAVALRDVRRWVAAHADLARLPEVMRELLDADVEVRVRRAQALKVPQGIEGGAAVALANADVPRLERAAVIEVEPALAANLATRAVRRKPPVVVHAGAAASGSLSGTLAAIAAAAMRRAHGGIATRVLAAGPAPALEADLAGTGQELVAVSLTVLVSDEAFEARVVAPRCALLGLPPLAWNDDAAAALGAMPLALPVVALCVPMAAAELATLGAGDALVLPGWPLARSSAGGPTGPVTLAAPSSEAGVEAQLVEDGRLVLRGDVVPLCAAEGGGMDRSGLIEAIGDVPIVVRVEIGEALMTAREWATIGRGDVVALGRRVGEPVLLRVGGVVVARGDLVEIDGEVGVRVVERVGGQGASP